jgi:diguanylate cyclase (GGDEF)-like protein/PAS domain S-box-containing protein
MPEKADFFKNLVDDMYDGVYFVDLDRRITYWNHGAERITGYKSEFVFGHSCRDNLLNHISADGKLLCNDGCPLAACMLDGETREAEVFLHHADGHRLPVHVRAAPMKDDNGRIIGAVETFNRPALGRTYQTELNELRHKANTDGLTGLRNRTYIEARITGLLAASKGGQDLNGLLFIDVDRFKEVNDTFGHDVGDKVLTMVARTIQTNLRNSDVVGRWGGDEFIGIILDIDSLDVLRSISEKIRTLTEYSSLDVDGQSISITVSIGGTLLHENDTGISLINRADALMYECKQAGRNRIMIR